MLPEERLAEAVKQIHLARASETVTEVEKEWLSDAVRHIQASRASLADAREASEDSEVLE